MLSIDEAGLDALATQNAGGLAAPRLQEFGNVPLAKIGVASLK